MIKELIKKNRSYRRFFEKEKIPKKFLEGLVELTRFCASSGNLQPLKFIISNQNGLNEKIFPLLSWAGYLKDWAGPEAGERPSAYIIILGDKDISPDVSCDHGIAAQSILLGAVEKGFGGCMIGSINRKELRKALIIPEKFNILLVLALGKPKEKVVVKESRPDGDIKYWRDRNNVHHVPKRPLNEIIVSFTE